MDPLQLLRQLNQRNALPALPSTLPPPPGAPLVLGDYTIAHDAETGWPSRTSYTVLALLGTLPDSSPKSCVQKKKVESQSNSSQIPTKFPIAFALPFRSPVDRPCLMLSLTSSHCSLI